MMCIKSIRLASLALLLPVRFSTAAQQSPTDKQATVVFYRLQEAYALTMKPSLFSDGIQLGRMRNGRFIEFKVPPGTHTLTSTSKQSGVIIDLKPGQTYYFRLQMSGPAMFHPAHGEITAVSPEQGQYAVAHLKAAEAEDSRR